MSKEYNQSNHTHQYSVSPQNHARHSNDGFKRKAGKNNEDKEYNCLPIMYSFVNYAQQMFNYKSDSP